FIFSWNVTWYTLHSYLTVVNYLFAGVPIFNALRFIININATKLSEIIAPTRAKAGYRRQYQIQSCKK
ncbi:MAG: hypothetical protein QN756_09335, partial [Nitrososphaeraceae archaeon]|nr:hypothetical protein [Nitrososphaeraceae archaeon]